MDLRVRDFATEVDKVTHEYQKFRYLSRAKEFQEEACKNLSDLKKAASALKKEMAELKDEDSANAMLSFEQMIDALIYELKMWIAFKEDDPNSAWDLLVNAQDAARTAMQAHKVASHLDPYIERLHMLENLLFPPITFFSPGFIIKHSQCSICGLVYGDCDHIVGRAFMGEMCSRIISEAELGEMSIVEEPANKHARILAIQDGGVTRDFLTWRVTISPSAQPD